VHAPLDDSNSRDQHPRTMPNHHPLPAILQLPRRRIQIAGPRPPPSPTTLLLLPSLPPPSAPQPHSTRLSLPSTNNKPPHQQYWRLLTPFLYFGPLNLDLLFHVFFQQRYSRLLEESSGRSPAHFAWLLLYASTALLLLSPLLSLPFLGSGLSSTLVYVWSRRNPDTRLSFLGLLVFTAPYLPWVLMAFSLVLHGLVPKDEIAGVVVGHGAFAWFPGSRPSLSACYSALSFFSFLYLTPPCFFSTSVNLTGGGRGSDSVLFLRGPLPAAPQ